MSEHQQIIKNLADLASAKSTWIADYVPLIVALLVLLGVILTLFAAARRQHKDQEAEQQREYKKLHREKLEEALRLILAFKEWGDDVMADHARFSSSVEPNYRTWERFYTLLGAIRGEGETKYEMVLAILEIYSDINDAEVRLGNPFLAFKKDIIKKLPRPEEPNPRPDYEELIQLLDDFIAACNSLVIDVREEIHKYKP